MILWKVGSCSERIRQGNLIIRAWFKLHRYDLTSLYKYIGMQGRFHKSLANGMALNATLK